MKRIKYIVNEMVKGVDAKGVPILKRREQLSYTDGTFKRTRWRNESLRLREYINDQLERHGCVTW